MIRSSDSWVKNKLREAKTFVKQWFDGKISWKDYPMFLVNTKEGMHGYFKETGKSQQFKQAQAGIRSMEV